MLGIVIILNVFFMVVHGLIFQSPDYSSFCPSIPVAPATETSKASPNEIYGDPAQQIACQNSYDLAQKNYEAKSFVLLLGLGLLALIIGMFPLGSTIVSLGLSYGGVLTFILASAQYWNDAPQITQLFISALALGALLYTGLKHYRD
jgi:hypothetical protein